MAAATELTWDGPGTDAPRRPSTDDLGGDEKQDNADYPPNDVEHFTAAAWNQLVKQLVAQSKVSASCKIKIATGGAGSVAQVSAPGTSITAATFTVTLNGSGDISVTWPANTFPPHACAPTGLTLFKAGGGALFGTVEEVTDGIRVRTYDDTGSAANPDYWSIEIN